MFEQMKTKPLHPSKALYDSGEPIPVIPSCVHYAGNEKFLRKAFDLQDELGPVFDICADLEDGSEHDLEVQQLEMICDLISERDPKQGRIGVRIHDARSAFWKKEIKVLLKKLGNRLAFVTLPKTQNIAELKKVLSYYKAESKRAHIKRPPPLHILIESLGALRDVWQIAAQPGIQALEFGLLDFISAHQGVIPETCMKSPGQFEHKLVSQAKVAIVSAALANGLIPSHNICTDVKNPEQTHLDARRARDEFGFLRMWSIHPSQIEAILRAMHAEFSLTEVSKAVAVLLLAESKNWGPVRYQDELHDRASYRHYWNLLQRVRVMGMGVRIDPAVERWFSK